MVFVLLVSGVNVCGITRECDGTMVLREGVHRYQVVLNIWGDDCVSYIQCQCRGVDLFVAGVCDGVRCVSCCSCEARSTYRFGCVACMFEVRGMSARIQDVTRTLGVCVGDGVYGGWDNWFYGGVGCEFSSRVLSWLTVNVLHVCAVRVLCFTFVVVVCGGVVETAPFVLPVCWEARVWSGFRSCVFCGVDCVAPDGCVANWL